MVSNKRAILSIIIISIVLVPVLSQKRIYARNNNIIRPIDVGYNSANTNKQNMMEKIVEHLSVGSVNLVTSYKVDEKWRAEIKAYEINRNWDMTDTVELQIAGDMNISYTSEDGMITVYFNNSDFQLGSVATLLFNNLTRYEYGTIFINFSNSKDLIFQTEALKKLVVGEDAIDYSYLFGETREITILQEQGIVEEHKNTGIIPPHEIEEADSDVMLYRSNKASEWVSQVNDYEVYNTDAEYIRSFQSPFAAIEYIVKNDLEGHTAYEVNGGQEIFRYERDRDDLFYIFDRSSFYGTADVMEATHLTILNKYFHSIRADGIFGSGGENSEILPKGAAQPYSHSYRMHSYGNTEPWTLEGNTGAYVYKKSSYYGSYIGSSSLLLLTRAHLRPYGYNDTEYTAYAYLGLNTIQERIGEFRDPTMAFACDLGIMSGSNDAGAWYLYTNANINGDIITRKDYIDDPIVTSTYLEETDGFVGNQDVYLYLDATKPGYVYIIAINTTTLKTQQAYVFDHRLDPRNKFICFMEGTKLVPDVWDANLPDVRIVSDINSGAYLRNLHWYRSTLYYIPIIGNKDKALWGETNAMESILMYDDEHAWYTYLNDYSHRDAVGGIVDIHYSPTHR